MAHGWRTRPSFPGDDWHELRDAQRARRDDVVAVLGKGHERGQQVGTEMLPFADDDVVREVWAELQRTPSPAAEDQAAADQAGADQEEGASTR